MSTNINNNTLIIVSNTNQNEYPEELSFQQNVRTEETQIYIRNNNVRDCVIIDSCLNDFIAKYYPFVQIRLLVEIKEFRKSSDLFNGVCIEDKDGNPVKTWELKRHQGDYEYYSIDVDKLNSSQFYIGNGQYKIRFKYYCLQNHHFQDWFLQHVKLTFILKQHL